MSNDSVRSEPHSARVLDDTRNHWWNDDFLALIAARTGLDRCARVLDVGCGQGHFTRKIASLVQRPFEIVGVDREPRWVAVAEQRARPFLARTGLEGTLRFVEGAAESLPFESGSFDAVTCQTVLMHLRDPEKALDEFARVLAPGGLILAAEPNNYGALQRLAHRPLGQSLEEALAYAEVFARIIDGKRALGEGDNALGARLPALFARFRDAQYYTSDRTFRMAPPYETDAEQLEIERLRDRVSRGEAGWSRREASRYWVAGGGDPARADEAYERLAKAERDELTAIDRGTYTELTAIVLFIAAART